MEPLLSVKMRASSYVDKSKTTADSDPNGVEILINRTNAPEVVKIDRPKVFLLIFLSVIAIAAYLTFISKNLTEERFQGIFLIMMIHILVVFLIKQYKARYPQKGSTGLSAEF